MAPNDQLLDCDVAQDDDALYRMLHAGKVVYLWIKTTNIIPDYARCHSPSLVKWLSRNCKPWHDTEWTTLIVSRDDRDGQLQYEMDADTFPTHTAAHEKLEPEYQRYNFLDLTRLKQSKHRVTKVQFGSTVCYLKIARFKFETRYLELELEVYHRLTRAGSALAPRLLGYVYDGDPARVIGFLLEEVHGRAAGIDDLESCTLAIQELHRYGIIHGDVNRYNMLVTTEGVKLIDFEDAMIRRTDSNEDEWVHKQAEELSLIDGILKDESGTGIPYEWGRITS